MLGGGRKRGEYSRWRWQPLKGSEAGEGGANLFRERGARSSVGQSRRWDTKGRPGSGSEGPQMLLQNTEALP